MNFSDFGKVYAPKIKLQCCCCITLQNAYYPDLINGNSQEKKLLNHWFCTHYRRFNMKDDSKSLLIKIFAIFFLAYGSFQLITGLKPLWFSIRFLFYPSQNTLSESLYYFVMILFFKLLIPACAIASGTGLFKQKKWGWYLGFITTLILFSLYLTGTINSIILVYRYRNTPIPPIPEGAVVQYVSMIPTYIYTIVSFLFLIILTRRSIRMQFSQ